MPFTIYPEIKLVVSYFSGPIVYQDIIDWVDELSSNESFSKEYDGIVDLRKAVFTDPTPDKARSLSSYMMEHNFTQGKLAVLVDKPTETALVILHRQAEGGRRPVEIFSTVEAAADFIDKDAESIKMLLGD